LERAGCDFIIIVCNTAHYFLDQLEPELSIPILSILDVVAEAVKQAGLEKVGLLATRGTIEANIYQAKLSECGIETLIPDKRHESMVMAAIRSIKAAPTDEEREKATGQLKAAAQYLLNQGAQGIIGGCTEIPLALGQKDLQVLFFDSQLLLARAAVVKAGLVPLDQN
jgi:aspartate racemase